MYFSLHIIATGIVQGVNLRYNIYQYAISNNLFGIVKNLLNFNEVEVFIQGKKEGVNNFINWLKTNPGSSRIEKIKILKKDKIENPKFNDFQIVY